jgi:4a-hydroxytetrahydrobiopterin dehydratase
MAGRLTDQEITTALGELDGWQRNDDQLVRTFSFVRFADGIAAVQRVAAAADEMDHHPDIDIRYTKVRFALSSHDAGGITARDVRLARLIDELCAAGPLSG